jgi:hypothetical protein
VDDVELAAQAYVAGYPLVVSVRTMQRLAGLMGVNRLVWQDRLAGPRSRVIVAPNRDTLYSVAVLDLRSEPMALRLPEVTDRYFSYQLLDAWTESFAYVGTPDDRRPDRHLGGPGPTARSRSSWRTTSPPRPTAPRSTGCRCRRGRSC